MRKNGASMIVVLMTAMQGLCQTLAAPFLVSAEAADHRAVLLTWRNNAIDAQTIHILRKTEGESGGLVDSVPASHSTWSDSNVVAEARYSYSLVAVAPGVRSDSSNTVEVTMPAAPVVLHAPDMSVSWHHQGDSVVVSYEDSSTSETAHVLYRKQWPGPWMPHHTIPSARPAETGSRQFIDRDLPEHKWLSYKVAAANETDTLFSSDTTIYNYEFPRKTTEYSMERIGVIPANPISWVEKLGDSLFFPELVGGSGLAIAVVSITEPQTPRFVAYLDTASLPSELASTPVGAKVRLGAGCRLALGSYLLPFWSGQASMLVMYDSVSYQPTDSMEFSPGDYPYGFELTAVAPLNDTMVLVETDGTYVTGRTQTTYRPLLINGDRLDTLPMAWSWTDGPGFGWYSGIAFRGTCGNKALYSTWSGYSTTQYTGGFLLQDFSFGVSRPLTFHFMDDVRRLDEQSHVVVDSATACLYSTRTPAGTDFTFVDRFDAHAGPESNLGVFTDSLATDNTILAAFADREREIIMTVGSSAITVYRYGAYSVDVKRPKAAPKRTGAPTIQAIVTDCQLLVSGPRSSLTTVRVFAPNGKQLARVPLSQGNDTVSLPLGMLSVRTSGLYLCVVEDRKNGATCIVRVRIAK